MKVCPNCGLEYKSSVMVCPDCNVKLITKKEKKELDKKYKDWEIVYSTNNLYEAKMIKANLESVSIECMILNQRDSAFQVDGDLSVIKVLVPKYRVSEALEIIENLESNENDNDE